MTQVHRTPLPGARPAIADVDKRIGWGLVGIAAAANAAGYLLGLWSQIGWYDEAVHFYASFALTLLLGMYLYEGVLSGTRAAALPLVLVIASVGIAIGAVWEIAEWLYDLWLAPGDAILGKPDTMFDLVLDSAGALLAGVIAVSHGRD